ncbi:hypothetical protein [Cytobacillus oceanisediminis]|uniref:hypothetical protein n=1 Tax=Cytobacillus oceanisediminis TaxID=665099 RepID=UPI0020B23EC0|nr:hypothetical protein [Cytobacillus oceanisediminis]
MHNESYLDRKERLKGEGKVELPLNIDTKKYLIWKISFQDLIMVAPFAIFSGAMLVYLRKSGNLSLDTFFPSIIPVIFMLVIQSIKHPIRKNLTFLDYKLKWRFKYVRRNKTFYYSKGAIEMDNTQDTRLQLGIKNVFSGCYETTDNRFVKVLEITSVNLSLMNRSEKRNIFESYRTFLNELHFIKRVQMAQIAQPINLTQYLLHIDKKTSGEQDRAKRILAASYKKYIEDIQKSRNMVTRKRYIIIDNPISSDREKSLEELERKVKILKANIENMLTGDSRLEAKILQNDDLLKLMYTTLDYDSAQALGNYIVGRAQNQVSISLGEHTARKIIDTYQKQLEEKIN